ncbi:MAG TPA: endolytic transglycosylase MltG [Patescibacteria group bacterium]|nr:endolytic transglycosylase MltG [Patescibacteria group bacterium]
MFKPIKTSIAIIILAAVSVWVFYTYQITISASDSAEIVNFEIKSGEGVNQISRNLYDQGLINNMLYFEIYVWQKNLERNFIAGVHELSGKLNIKEVTARLTNPGDSELTITIIEGLSNKDIAEYLVEKELIKENDFLNLVSQNLSQFVNAYGFLEDKPADADLEGYLFPDTYRVFKNASATEIVKKMLDNFDHKLTEKMRADIASREKTVFEIITLAAIIEKEVRTPEDMRIVSDIFNKRLEAGIALQSDATINYITGQGRIQPSLADLEVDSPYNTYKHRGLPPTPIVNPGLNAILAAIYPEANPYYYFLTTKDTGEVIYSRTYEEHLANKAKYLQ